MNNVCIVGNLGADPELKYVGNASTAVMELRIATNERRKERGEWIDAVEWHTVVVWDKRAEGLAKLGLGKGDKVGVVGSIRTDTYEKDGERRYKTKIVARDVTLCGGRRKSAPEPGSDGDDVPF